MYTTSLVSISRDRYDVTKLNSDLASKQFTLRFSGLSYYIKFLDRPRVATPF